MMLGVSIYPLKQIRVSKGDVYHALKSTDLGYVGFGETYFSWIEYGEVKGWKRHNRMTLNLVVPEPHDPTESDRKELSEIPYIFKI